MGKLDSAQEQFRKCIDDPKTPPREKTLSHLHLGRILDSRGYRNEAIKQYESVLALEDVENSRKQAKRLLARARR